MTSRNIRPRRLEATQKVSVIKQCEGRVPNIKLPTKNQDSKGCADKALSITPNYRLVEDPVVYDKKCLPLEPFEPATSDGLYEITSWDEEWLQFFINAQCIQLTNEQFKRMIRLLEMASYEEFKLHHHKVCGEASEMVQNIDMVSNLDHLKMKDAIDLLMAQEGVEQHICEKLYLYWRKLRLENGMPLLKSLQAPTLTTDTNPEKTFRSRQFNSNLIKSKGPDSDKIKGIDSSTVLKSRTRRLAILCDCFCNLHNTSLLDTRIKMASVAKDHLRTFKIMHRAGGREDIDEKKDEIKRVLKTLNTLDGDDKRYSAMNRERIKPFFGGNVGKMLLHSKGILPAQLAPNQFLERCSEKQREQSQLFIALREQQHADILEKRFIEEKCNEARLATEKDPDAKAIVTYIDREADYLEKAGTAEGMEPWETQAIYQREYETLRKRRLSASDSINETKYVKIESEAGPIESNECEIVVEQEENKEISHQKKSIWEKMADKLENVKVVDEAGQGIMTGIEKSIYDTSDIDSNQMTTRHTTQQRKDMCETPAKSDSSSTKEEDAKSPEEPFVDINISHETLRKIHPALYQLSSSERAEINKLKESYFTENLKNIEKCKDVFDNMKYATSHAHLKHVNDGSSQQLESFNEERSLITCETKTKPVYKREIDKRAVQDAEKAFTAVKNSILSGELQLLHPDNKDNISVPSEGRTPRIGPSGTSNCIDWHYHDLDGISKIKTIFNGKYRKIWTRRDLEDYAYSKPHSLKKIKEFIFQRRELLETFGMNDELYDNYEVVNVEPEQKPEIGNKMIALGNKEADAQKALLEGSSTSKFCKLPKKTLYEELIEFQKEMDRQKEEDVLNSDYKLACLLQEEEDKKFQQKLPAKKEEISSGAGLEQVEEEEVPTAEMAVEEEIEDNQSILALKSEDNLSCELINITDVPKFMAREVKKKHKENKHRISEIYKVTSSNPISKITRDSHDNLIAMTFNDDHEQSKSYLINVHSKTIKDIKVIHKKVTAHKKSRMDASTDPNCKFEVTGEIEEIHEESDFKQHSKLDHHLNIDNVALQKPLLENEQLPHVFEEEDEISKIVTRDTSRKWIYEDLIKITKEYINDKNNEIKTFVPELEEQDDKITYSDIKDDLSEKVIEEAIYHHQKDLTHHQTLDIPVNKEELDIEKESTLRMGRNKQIYTCNKNISDKTEEILEEEEEEEEDPVEAVYKQKAKEYEEEVSEEQIMHMLEQSGQGPSSRTRQRKRLLEEIMSNATGEESSHTKARRKK